MSIVSMIPTQALAAMTPARVKSTNYLGFHRGCAFTADVRAPWGTSALPPGNTG